MKLIEVVFLTGAHCVSPIQHTTPMTEVFKVQCAVVVLADTVAHTLTVTPDTAAGNPLVIAAAERLQGTEKPPLRPALPPDRPQAAATPPEGPESSSSVATAPEQAAPATPIAPEAEEAEEMLPSPSPAVPAKDVAPQTPASEFKARPEVIGTNLIEGPPAQPDTVDAPPPLAEAMTSAAEAEPPKTKTKSRTARTSKKPKAKAKNRSDQCGGTKRAVWYTNKDGKRKYRCLRSSRLQLY